MQKLFNKILVPVDFSSLSKEAVDKAIETATQYDCSIHLLHATPISPVPVVTPEGPMTMPYNLIDNKSELEFELKKLADHIHLLTDNKISAEYSIQRGTWNEVVIDMVNQKKFDLVLIGQKGRIIRKRRMLLNPDKIAAKTNIPVITIPAARKITQLFAIVIPITDFLPVRKLMYAVYMASKHNTTIKLLGIENGKTKDKVKHYLKKAYQLIHENCDMKVELEIITGQNVAETVNRFAILRSADLIILNPGTQTKMPGFLSSLWGNIIQRYSFPPVLTVNPV